MAGMNINTNARLGLFLTFSLFGIFSMLLVIETTEAKKISEATEENCEVCVKHLTKFINSLDESTKSDHKKVEEAFRKSCKKSKNDDNRFCYYVGGLEESATGMLGEMSKPISWSMPADKVCMKLYRKDAQICDLKYEKTFDFSKVNFKKLKVNELKQILLDWGEDCKGCTEKSDYINLVEQLLPKYAPDAAKARAEL
ncbi:hypothetical protein HELRODRAFT_176222 [Helobdella robusta]|uniref:Mesencephalic astrocyte-derived neurotrophic factor homolog n=1 Tax=Helobdella robusta TaxID=6412 RepID=T1FAB3_HELRO|nr:hypothetical protein HELRODRAFT_176222 [Helobdella robusta]ESN99926.1 hypothetical protein HELRODRAFT_176222 [Helobdella robusta]